MWHMGPGHLPRVPFHTVSKLSELWDWRIWGLAASPTTACSGGTIATTSSQCRGQTVLRLTPPRRASPRRKSAPGREWVTTGGALLTAASSAVHRWGVGRFGGVAGSPSGG